MDDVFLAKPEAISKKKPFQIITEFENTSLFGKALNSHARSFCTGRILKMEAEHDPASSIYVVLSGWLALSKSMEDGQRHVIDFVLPGDILNPASANENLSAVQIEVISKAEVSVISNSTWQRMIDDMPELEGHMRRLTASVLSRMSERLLRLGKGTAQRRIAYCLLEIYLRLEAIGKADNCSFHLPLNQQQLGEFAGLSSVHVCRTIRRLSRQSILVAHGQMDIFISDLEELCEIAGVDVQTLTDEIIPAE